MNTTLLEQIRLAVDLLVRPARHEVWQDFGPEHGGRRLSVGFSAPLLDQLFTSIGSGGGTGAGGVGEKRTRNILDASAVELWYTIRETTYTWHKYEQEYFVSKSTYTPTDKDRNRYTLSPQVTLTKWFKQFAKRVSMPSMPDADDVHLRRVLSTLRGWATAIEAKFDPPRRAEVLVRCPALLPSEVVGAEFAVRCDQRYFEDEYGDRSSALVAVLRPGDLRVMCKSCGTVWAGEHELRSLAHSSAISDWEDVFAGDGGSE